MFEIAAVFVLLVLVIDTLNVPHLVGKTRPMIKAGEASRFILRNLLVATAVYYVWQQRSHTEIREILAIVLGAALALDTITAVAKIHGARRIITANNAAVLVTVRVALLVMAVYLVAT